jgi:hypothetical protein
MVDMRDDGEIADIVDRMRGHVGRIGLYDLAVKRADAA